MEKIRKPYQHEASIVKRMLIHQIEKYPIRSITVEGQQLKAVHFESGSNIKKIEINEQSKI